MVAGPLAHPSEVSRAADSDGDTTILSCQDDAATIDCAKYGCEVHTRTKRQCQSKPCGPNIERGKTSAVVAIAGTIGGSLEVPS